MNTPLNTLAQSNFKQRVTLASVIAFALFSAGCASKSVMPPHSEPPAPKPVAVVTAQPIAVVATPLPPAAPVAAPAPIPAPAPKQAAAPAALFQPETGLYRCEEKQTVAVKRVLEDGKKIVVNYKTKDYDLTLTPSDTGAIRYDNKAAGYSWIYVVGKAFLLDSKRGNRIANDCKL